MPLSLKHRAEHLGAIARRTLPHARDHLSERCSVFALRNAARCEQSIEHFANDGQWQDEERREWHVLPTVAILADNLLVDPEVSVCENAVRNRVIAALPTLGKDRVEEVRGREPSCSAHRQRKPWLGRLFSPQGTTFRGVIHDAYVLRGT